MSLELFGLLHLKEGERSTVNSASKGFGDQIESYVLNAVTLANSLRQRGIAFTLLTNRKDLIESVLVSRALDLNIVEIPFPTAVPSGIRFYSAHFKFDALRYLSTLPSAYIGICDLDVVCINAVPQALSNLMARGTPLAYDISDLVIPAYGHEIIVRDLRSIHGLASEGRWSGGEFLAGPPAFFKTLVSTIDELFPKYLEVIGQLHHVGDEAVASAAIEIMRNNGYYIADAGTLGLIGRYWNLDTQHVQRAFRHYESCFLLHLPADKPFLAGLAANPNLDRKDFLRSYARYRHAPKVTIRRWLLRLRDSVRRLSQKKHAGAPG